MTRLGYAVAKAQGEQWLVLDGGSYLQLGIGYGGEVKAVLKLEGVLPAAAKFYACANVVICKF